MLIPRIVGSEHWDQGNPGLLPFAVGRLSDSRGYVHVVDDEGWWAEHLTHPDKVARDEADRISYVWDELIEHFIDRTLSGETRTASHAGIEDQEVALRLLARENRVRRRLLSKSFTTFLERGIGQRRAARLLLPSRPGDPHCVFLTVDKREDQSYDEYREFRENLLAGYIKVAKLKFPTAEFIAGIATEPLKSSIGRSEDFMVLDASSWDDELAAEARLLRDVGGILNDAKRFETTEFEYPRLQQREMAKGRNRNRSCPCGSGRKFKKCCGQLA